MSLARLRDLAWDGGEWKWWRLRSLALDVIEAASEAAVLESDPALSDEQNAELTARAEAFRVALGKFEDAAEKETRPPR